ncbi:UPF0175 family protein [Halobacteria archaeon AArc-m2/3/4]|uniref:UPF0175 family protein n=1 Tax=Natronoglomus mannanivorans TaxID=2979990 RepID=A0AAP2Z1W5_9EURY|nr:UPF0175 family protein [Halobacteria archaeon AArc-xg1-1]MCU4975028.1 UPF0175 family protein [Halobacteria archaeon AArc-m2/3/4]
MTYSNDCNSDGADELATTIGLYVLGEISLGKAAERRDITRWEMAEFLSEVGVEVRLGPQSMESLEDEIVAALEID